MPLTDTINWNLLTCYSKTDFIYKNKFRCLTVQCASFQHVDFPNLIMLIATSIFGFRGSLRYSRKEHKIVLKWTQSYLIILKRKQIWLIVLLLLLLLCMDFTFQNVTQNARSKRCKRKLFRRNKAFKDEKNKRSENENKSNITTTCKIM